MRRINRILFNPIARVHFVLADLIRLDRRRIQHEGTKNEKSHEEQADAQPDLAEVQHRLLMAQVLEAVRALEEGVLTDIREGNVGAILGWGFAPWSGGPFGWLDILGAARAVELADALAARHGDRFAPPKLLRDMAAAGETFYGRFGDGRKAAA